MAPHAPTYGDIRSQTATYPTQYAPYPYSYPRVPDSRHRSGHLLSVHHSQQMSVGVYPTVERGILAQHRPCLYTRGSITNTNLTEEPAPMMSHEETTIGKKRKRADADQLNTPNKAFARRAPSSTEKRGELATKLDTSAKGVQIRLVYAQVTVLRLIPLIGFKTSGSQ
jgi:homeobox protein YOX1/YHP1